MKTKIISTLKKELLIIELPRLCDYELTKEGLFVKEHGSHLSDYIEGSYTLLGSPDEISEEDARDLVESFGRGNLKRFKGYNKKQFEKTAKESLLSAIETEIFWDVNPASFDDNQDDPEIRREMRYRWELAEEKTFDRKRTLIFKKNK